MTNKEFQDLYKKTESNTFFPLYRKECSVNQVLYILSLMAEKYNTDYQIDVAGMFIPTVIEPCFVPVSIRDFRVNKEDVICEDDYYQEEIQEIKEHGDRGDVHFITIKKVFKKEKI